MASPSSRSTRRPAGVPAGVEVDGAEDGLEGVGEDGGLGPATRCLLAPAQQEDLADAEPIGHLRPARGRSRRPSAPWPASPRRSRGTARSSSPATMSPSTASPRNSKRSLDGAPPSCSPHQLRCARACCRRLRSPKVWPSRAASTAAPSAPASPLLELGDHVVDGVPHGPEVFEVFILDPEPHGALPQLFLEGLHQLDQSQRVGVEILGEGGGLPTVMERLDLQNVRPAGPAPARRPPGGRGGPGWCGSLLARRTVYVSRA